MLSQTKVDLIRQLHHENYSQREIARRVKVARETVRRIASGKRRDDARQAGEPLLLFEGEPERCLSCGGMVYMPCLACRLREQNPAFDVRAPGSVSKRFGKDHQSGGNI